jgi:hypothetical protein
MDRSRKNGFSLDISYKRMRVLERRAEGPFEPSDGKLRSSFLKLWVVTTIARLETATAQIIAGV